MFKTLRTLLWENVSDLNEWLKSQRDYTQSETEVLKKFHKEIEELKTFKSDMQKVFTLNSTISWTVATYRELKIEWQTNCYFTWELIAEKATNTKVIYVVNGPDSKKVFAKECNLTKDVKEINGKLYLFI